MTNEGLDVWIGLADLRSAPDGEDILDGAAGAYSYALALASDPGDFLRLAAEMFRQEGLQLHDIEEVEQLETREAREDVATEIVDLARHLTRARPADHGPVFVYEREYDA